MCQFSARMNERLYIICFVFKSFLCGEIEIHANSSNNALLSDDKPLNAFNTDLKIISVKNNKTVAVLEYFPDAYESIYIDPDIKIRSDIICEPVFTLELFHVSTSDAGKYIFERKSGVTSVILYVLNKPSLPEMAVLDNGIVDLSTAEIVCHSKSNSAPAGLHMSYTWFVNNSKIDFSNDKYNCLNENGSILQIHVNRSEATNSYSCIATEKYGQSSFSSLIIHVFPKSPPLVQIAPKIPTLKIVEYERYALSCTTNGAVPEVSLYTWYKTNGEIQSSHSDNLTLHNISRTDASSYICVAYNGLPINGSDSINVEVLYGPDIDIMMPVSQEDGFGLNITCNISSNPPVEDANVTWSRDNSSHFSLIGRTFMIPHLNKNDHGQFICSVKLSLEPTYGPSVVKYGSQTLDVNVLYGPKVSSIDKITSEEGKDVYIACQIDSNPLATNNDVIWYFTNSMDNISSNLGIGIAYNISAIQRNESGKYVCMVNITLKPTHEQQVDRSGSSSIIIDVLYEPFIKAYDQETVLELQVANLTCNIVGNPKPTVTWIYRPTNQSFNESDVIHHSLIEVSSILMFPRASCNNTGSYMCVANNNINKPAHKINNLYVRCSPRLASYSVPHRNLTVTTNDTLNFTEWFEAYPQPSFHFFKSNHTEEIEKHGFNIMNISNNQFLYKTGSQIQKQKFEHSDIGEYVLVAANEIGRFNVSYNIIYTRKPDVPINVFVNCIDIYGTAIVQWNAGWNGGSEQQFKVFYKRIKDDAFSGGSSPPIWESDDDSPYCHSIDGLLPNQNYIFKVRASNIVGAKDSQETNCTTKDTMKNNSSDPMAIGIAIGSVFGIIVVAAIGSILLIRRRKSKKTEKQMELLKSRNDTDNVTDDSEEGLKDNVCYISADEVHNSANTGVEYAVVKKTSPKKDGLNSEKDITRNKEGTKKNDAYEIVDQMLKNKASTSHKPQRNKDGLQYADLVFDNTASKRRFIIIGQENKTNYSDIDFTQTAEPLPDEDEDEDEVLTETDVRQDGE